MQENNEKIEEIEKTKQHKFYTTPGKDQTKIRN
jgi:hypothetical protein